MTISQLKDFLKANNVPWDEYSLPPEEIVTVECAVCLRKRGDDWVIFVQERGEELYHKSFSHEETACRYFLEFGFPKLLPLAATA